MPKKQIINESEKTLKTDELLLLVLEELKGLKTLINKPITSQVESLKETSLEPQSITPEQTLLPIPEEFKQEVNQVLNNSFGIEIEPHADSQLMVFTVVVPERYSLMTPSQKEILKRDIRPKVISRAGGVNEVKEWVQTIFKNLTPEIQALVVADRIK